ERVGLGLMPLAEGVRLQRIGIGSTQNLNLWTSGGLLTSSNGGKTWASVGQSTEPGRDLYTIIHQIHTGYFFADWFVYLYDIAAWGLIGLSISGLIIWWRTRKRRISRI
ncbi:MAG: PepSY domain-containing protein, partial [Candidatus Poribacteria bacterium]|nr:PepSY domain-containing protein [Candidatus Poribacteria bacterium]